MQLFIRSAAAAVALTVLATPAAASSALADRKGSMRGGLSAQALGFRLPRKLRWSVEGIDRWSHSGERRSSERPNTAPSSIVSESPVIVAVTVKLLNSFFSTRLGDLGGGARLLIGQDIAQQLRRAADVGQPWFEFGDARR